MRVTLAQTSPTLSRKNLASVLTSIKSVQKSSDLIVFSELALSGYMLQDKLGEDAWNVEELESIAELSLEIDVALGAALREDGLFTNAALYFHKGKLLSRHKKVHLPNYGMFEEARYFQAGDSFESFVVQNRRICMLVCEDLWHKDVHKDLIAQNPDIILALVASPARGFLEDSLEIQTQWYKIIQKVARECKAQLFFVNRVGFEDGLGFWGGSCIVNAEGQRVQQLENFREKIQTFEVE